MWQSTKAAGVLCKRCRGLAASPSLGMQAGSGGIYTYIYINIYMPITSFDGPLLGFKKARSRVKDDKLRQERGKDEKEDKTLKRGIPPHQVWGFFWAIFCCKTGEILRF